MCQPALAADLAAPKPWASWRLASSGNASKQGTTREDGVAPAGQGFSSFVVCSGFRQQHKTNPLRPPFVDGLYWFGTESDGRRTILITDGGCRRPLCFTNGRQILVSPNHRLLMASPTTGLGPKGDL